MAIIGPLATNSAVTRAPIRRIRRTRKGISPVSLGQEEGSQGFLLPRLLGVEKEQSSLLTREARVTSTRAAHLNPARPKPIVGNGGPINQPNSLSIRVQRATWQLLGQSVTLFNERPLLSPPGDCTGQPDNSGNKRLPRSPRGVPWLPKTADFSSQFHREPPWRCPTRLVPVGSVHPASRVCCYHSGLFRPKQPKPDPTTVQPNS
ncbi:hypothetical protein CRG98_030834 [Punica granatum]|uniref:Uncharacterized protein n=1 Tax=Punica granatum TaxID=22663 RepID=A0A2I0IXP8_PUNGR|nr:hypothetical protein CRG98_030834 [Punica granatum]